MNSNPTNWWAFIGGLLLVLVLGVIAIPGGFLLGLFTNSIFGFWLVATFAPVLVLAGLALLLRLASRDLGKGMLIGVCLVFLVAGACNWAATELGKEMPRVAG